MWQAIESIIRKGQSINDLGVNVLKRAIRQGEENYKANDPEIEKVAKKRAKFLIDNDMIKKEPIKGFRFVDERIPELSEMMVKGCGCPAGKFVRQNIITHDFWDEE